MFLCQHKEFFVGCSRQSKLGYADDVVPLRPEETSRRCVDILVK
ncbi:MAG TPA: hypothetical protein PKH24_12910 [Sedimentisphaerales bacterium]|nr:hypothetical protein [Sedimentisphaerales bacterium]HNU29657.1 hypothetical protein [Sedimentisphaerales bacterium]